jgi:transcription initiation factor IIE alpha subunit
MKKLLYEKIIKLIGNNEYSTNEILKLLIKEKLFTTYETLRKDLAYMHSKNLIQYKYGKTEEKKVPYRIYYIINQN